MTLVAIVATAVASTGGAPKRNALAPALQQRLATAYGGVPLHFEENLGQTDPRVRFLARGRGYGLFLTPTESVLALHRPKEASAPPVVVRMKLLGANQRPVVRGSEKLPGRSNYLIGSDPKKWSTDVAQYARVEYEEVYPGIRLTYYGNQKQLEYDFVVAPGADPKQIRLAIEGADSLHIDAAGNLVLGLPDGEVVQRAPVIYQEVHGSRRPIAGRFALRSESEVGFEVDAYEPRWPLVLDPVLTFSSSFGGSLEEQGRAVAVDRAGNSYVTGFTMSTDFPTVNPMQAANAGEQDGFVMKLDPSGSIVYATYLGGSGHDGPMGVAVDASQNVYVMGFTNSADWPTVAPFQPAHAGFLDTFVAKINPAGDALVYSSYLGGSGSDQGNAIALDAAGNIYVTGFTTSMDFPTVNPIQPTFAGQQDAFVAKVNAAGSALVYSTYLGGNGFDVPWGIAADPAGAAYVAGYTVSTNFPGAPLPGSSACYGNAFVTKLNPAGSAFAYSDCLGGSGFEMGNAVAVDASGNAYVTGRTESTDFPLVGAVQASHGGGTSDAFVAKIDAAGSALIFSTYLGGDDWDEGFAIAVDGSGRAAVTGWSASQNFPIVRAVQPTHGGGLYDAFVAKLAAAGSSLEYSTYLGGGAGGSGFIDTGMGITAAPSGAVIVAGITDSPDFPTRHSARAAIVPAARENWNAFVARIDPGPPGDFDYDGKPDLLWRDQGDTGLIAVWFMNGANRTGATLTTPEALPVLSWQIAGTADFNGDDKTDILWRDQGDTGQIVVWLMLGTTQTSSTPTDPSAVPNLNWRIVGLGDFNGDGKTDILWRDQGSTGQIAVWFMDGTTRTGATLTSPGAVPLLDWEIVGTGDFNRDAKTDILWRDTRSSGQIGVWFMDGTVRTGATLLTPSTFPLNAQIQAVSDYNGDGKPDIVWRDQVGTGLIGIWFMDGTTRTSATLTDPPAVPNLNWKIVGPR